jgi:hypothetical protein
MWEPDELIGPDLLAFAGIKPIAVPTLPLEQHVAEKVHAYTRTYAVGRASSRSKDLVDILLVKQFMELDAGRLRSALVGVFEKRNRHPLPEHLPSPPKEWAVPYRKLAREVGVEPDLGAAYDEARVFIDPVLSGKVSGRWVAKTAKWV